jgi:hypothetical protein
MDEWNESFWRDLSNEAFSSQVMSLYDSLTAEQRRAITNYMPAIPIPKILFKAGNMLDPEEVGMLTFYVGDYPKRFREPNFEQENVKHPKEMQMVWMLVKDEIEEYMDLYIKHCMLNKIKVTLKMTKEAKMFHDAAQKPSAEPQNKGSRGYKKDDYLHL